MLKNRIKENFASYVFENKYLKHFLLIFSVCFSLNISLNTL